MVAVLRESIDKSGVGESRATLRKRVQLRARVRDRAASRFDVTVIDLSMSGFRGETLYSLKPGTTIWITLPGLMGLEAEVAWQRGDYFGCRFQQPLHPAVFEHIAEAKA